MPFGLHPAYLIEIVFLLAILVGGAYVIGWGFRKGWEAARPAGKPPTDVRSEP
jgi:hypothetical protein